MSIQRLANALQSRGFQCFPLSQCRRKSTFHCAIKSYKVSFLCSCSRILTSKKAFPYGQEDWRHQNFHSTATVWNSNEDEASQNIISHDLIHHLERTSLVDFDSAEAVTRLKEAISFADQLFEVKTEGVEPLISVLENETLYLREDTAEPTDRREILKNACKTEEDYFVAPPGNIPLQPTSKEFLQKKVN